ncbi:MAG: NAD(P)H-hydrate dehydratase [Oceanipulchritudo sp.]
MTPMNACYPLFSIEEARFYETSILENDSGRTATAMEAAGRAIGAQILADYEEIRPWPASPLIWVLGGKGLNTGDALVACERLHETLPGLRVKLVTTAPEEDWNPLAKEVLDRLGTRLGEAFGTCPAEAFVAADPEGGDVVIDGLYGLGFRPPLKEPVAALLKAVNQRGDIRMRVAVDIPSGIGETADENCFRADFTCIPGVAKAPAFAPAHAGAVGRIRFLEIEPFLRQEGKAAAGQTLVASPSLYQEINTIRPAGSDKRSFGHGLVLAGSPGMPGAAIMAVMGALGAGAGLVTGLVPASVSGGAAGVLPEAMWQPMPIRTGGGLDVGTVGLVSELSGKASAILIGPGLNTDRSTSFVVCRIVRETPLPVVLDASALTHEVVSAILGRRLDAAPVVLTPHRGECARLLGKNEDPDDEAALLRFCQKYRVVMVLKGSPTLVCDKERCIRVPAGGPVLARGGSGDILAGMLLTLLGQEPGDALRAALRAVTWHGAAADSLARESGAVAVRTTDLIGHLSTSLRN